MRSTTPAQIRCSIHGCDEPAAYTCAGHECAPGLTNVTELCFECYFSLHGLLRTAFLGVSAQTCPHCGEVFAGPEDMLKVLDQGLART